MKSEKGREREGGVILYYVQCYALHWADNKKGDDFWSRSVVNYSRCIKQAYQLLLAKCLESTKPKTEILSTTSLNLFLSS